MTKPVTTNLPEPPDADLQPFEFTESPAGLAEVVPAFDQSLAGTEEEFIAQTLGWCAELFGASRARFIRPLESGNWVVYTRQQERETVLTHLADQAEIAMAYTVGLSKQPLVVTRPRISHFDGSGLRPIALKSYLGIPIVCQDRLVGVVEFAGEVRPDMESALYSAAPRLANVGERLLFDPGLRRHRETLTAGSSVVLSGGVRSRGDILISAEELSFLAAINGPTTLATLASATGMAIDLAIKLAADLRERGLITICSE
ncbi:MAG TPA: GAF domain-containing protein [Thermomicrobiales bacterium]|nr:GAF domain-containing protein [Thermomicrobiales bacterium]